MSASTRGPSICDFWVQTMYTFLCPPCGYKNDFNLMGHTIPVPPEVAYPLQRSRNDLQVQPSFADYYGACLGRATERGHRSRKCRCVAMRGEQLVQLWSTFGARRYPSVAACGTQNVVPPKLKTDAFSYPTNGQFLCPESGRACVCPESGVVFVSRKWSRVCGQDLAPIINLRGEAHFGTQPPDHLLDTLTRPRSEHQSATTF